MKKIFKSLSVRFCAAVTSAAVLIAPSAAGAAVGEDYYARITNNPSFFITEAADSDIEISFDGSFSMTGNDTASTWYIRSQTDDKDMKYDSVALKFYSYNGTQRVKIERFIGGKNTLIGTIAYENDIQSKISGFKFADWHKYTFMAVGNEYSLTVDGTPIITGTDTNAAVGRKIWMENYIDRDNSGTISASYDNIVISDGGEGYSENFNDGEWNGITGRTGGDANLIAQIAYPAHPSAPETDTTAPDFSNAAAVVSERRSDGFVLSWNPADDEVTAAEDIVYKVYAAETPIRSPEDLQGMTPAAELNGTVRIEISGLKSDTAYYIAVTAADAAGNTALWYAENPISTTALNTTAGQLTITADVGVSYVLSIPSSADAITSAGDHKIGTLYAEKLVVDTNGRLTVSADCDGTLTRTGGTETLAYTLKSADPAASGNPVLSDFAPVEFTNASGTGEENGKALYASVDQGGWNNAAAGTYTDVVTFRAEYTAE